MTAPSPPVISSPPSGRLYSEEEQRLRWALIIETILRDSPTPRAQDVAPRPLSSPPSTRQ